jgi:thiamine biosynthesis lipoprotein
MGTRLEMVLPGLDEEIADELFLKVKEKITGAENTLSIYRRDSEFARMNASAAENNFRLKPSTFKLIKDLVDYNTLTLGYFDPTLGVTKSDVFGSYSGDISTLIKIRMKDRLELSAEDHSIKYISPLVKFDSGAFGKGYALESLKMILLSYNIKNAFISFGDSSVMTLGKHPAGNCWKIGIRDLVNDDENAWVFELNEGSVSSSGNTNYNRVKLEAGHLVNPLNGHKSGKKGVVSVMGESAMIAEILSTALFIADSEKRTEIVHNFSQYKAIELVYNEDENYTEVKEIN